MIRHTASLVVRWTAGLAAGLALLVGFLVWRLSSGPVSLDYLAPYVAQSIAEAETGIFVQVDHTLVSLGRGATINIVARGVHLARSTGEAQLTLGELLLDVSLRAALRGVVAPTRIVVDAPDLRLERAADGTFHLGLGAETAQSDDDWAERLLHDIAAKPDRKGRLGYLTEVAVRNATLRIDDRALGVTWQARRADARLFRGKNGVYGTLALTVDEPGGAEGTIQSEVRYTAGQDRLSVGLNFNELVPAIFAGTAPALAPLAALQLPVAGQVRAELDTAALSIVDAGCELTIGAGRIEHRALAGGALAISGGQVSLAYDPAAGRVTLDQLRLGLAGPTVELSGTVDGVGGDILTGALPQAVDIAAELHLREVPVDGLEGLWPEALSPRSRGWITLHIHDGTVGALTARVAAHVDLSGGEHAVQVKTLEGGLDYRGLTVEYFKPLTPLRGVDGTATFDRAHLDLMPTTGAIKAVQVTGGTAKLSKLDTDDEEITIDLGIKGPLTDVLSVLDEKPLQYAHELKIDAARVTGQADGRLNFTFPLKHDLTLDMVDFGARAALSGVGVPAVMAGRDLTDGELQLRLDRAALKLDGTARLADVPATLTLFQSLKAKDAVRARYTTKARVDDAGRKRLGLDVLPDMIHGPIDVDATYTVMPGKKESLAAALDLKDTALDVAKLNWHKPPGAPATALLDVDFIDERMRAIRVAALKSDRVDARFSLSFGDLPDGSNGIMRVDVARAVVGDTDISGVVTRRSEGGWRIEAKGASFDAAGLMADIDRPSTPAEQTDPPLAIDAAVDRLLLAPGREARNVKAQLFSNGVHWQAASIDAALTGGGGASLRFGQSAGDHNFRLTASDFGALLRLLDISSNVAGGQLQVAGQVDDTGAGRIFSGKVDGSDYRIVGAPVFARLLSLASISGIGALLSGEGIPFTRLTGDFTLAAHKLEVKELRAYGGAIGLKVDGTYDLAADTLDLSGTLVPAYTINSVLGNIPILGKVLAGGEGEGVFAANFRVAGPSSDAKISVNPLSVVAPGFLRKLFLFDAPTPSAPQATGDSGNGTQRR